MLEDTPFIEDWSEEENRQYILDAEEIIPENLPSSRTFSNLGTYNSSLLNTKNLGQNLTLFYIEYYTRPDRLEWLRAVMERGGPYLGFIRQEIEERNLGIFLPFGKAS